MTTTGTGGRSGVLADLDHKSISSFYWSLTLLATNSGFLFGYGMANAEG